MRDSWPIVTLELDSRFMLMPSAADVCALLSRPFNGEGFKVEVA